MIKEQKLLEQKIDIVNNLDLIIENLILAEELSEVDELYIEEYEKLFSEASVIFNQKRIESMLSGDADSAGAFLEIHAGAGGTDSQDWVIMLLRMYSRWCDKKKRKCMIVEESQGEEAGLKSVTIEIDSQMAYGWLKKETGIHRLVRISPFDSNARRHTSFASVSVYPIADDSIDIEILDKDLRIDTYRASGAGGQHVNKTESAVRITHIPTGIVVQCQSDRSQHRNKATAMSMLKSKMYELEIETREAKEKQIEKTDNGWGHQIRSYVLHPYQMVKDVRTKCENGNANAVLDGDIDSFLEAALSEI
jgi:peptide chain release factor 2